MEEVIFWLWVFSLNVVKTNSDLELLLFVSFFVVYE